VERGNGRKWGKVQGIVSKGMEDSDTYRRCGKGGRTDKTPVGKFQKNTTTTEDSSTEESRLKRKETNLHLDIVPGRMKETRSINQQGKTGDE